MWWWSSHPHLILLWLHCNWSLLHLSIYLRVFTIENQSKMPSSNESEMEERFIEKNSNDAITRRPEGSRQAEMIETVDFLIYDDDDKKIYETKEKKIESCDKQGGVQDAPMSVQILTNETVSLSYIFYTENSFSERCSLLMLHGDGRQQLVIAWNSRSNCSHSNI